MVAIKTKSVYDLVEPEDGSRILVMRRWPRGMTGTRLQIRNWIKDLSPSPELLERYRRNSISWEEFAETYRREMAGLFRQFYISAIAQGCYGETVTLLCWERGTTRCHRFILKQLIEEAATDV